MKILWITSSLLPIPAKALGLPSTVFAGWISSLALRVTNYNEIQLGIATIYQVKEITSFDIEGIKYYILPLRSNTKYQKRLEPYWHMLINEFKPDLVHIHGTEYPHGLACMRVCPSIKYCISIQGLVGISARYYHAGINKGQIFSHITFRDVVRNDTLFKAKKKFEKKGIYEREYLLRSKHVIGRTNWDYVHSTFINPSIQYHFCNEILRNTFYAAKKWNLSNKTDYTIFLSQSFYPLKGLHQVLKAVAILRSEFPNIMVRVSGLNITNNKKLIDKIKINGYGTYVLSLIKKYELKDKIIFVGILSEEQMVAEYLNAHLFICPSSIENSPNSLGEAQLLGVPCVAAYVGGIPDMITHEKSGLLYRFEEFEMLAYYIRRLFIDDGLALKISEGGKVAAEKRHDKTKNTDTIISIYKKILEQNY